jgi:hypothetical protein
MKREHTEEEILELGRKALAKHKITVYVLQYTHKHGETISVYGGRKSAENAARVGGPAHPTPPPTENS